jgi:hypothetical protein
MSRSLRIGLIAEGEAELGPSVPYLKPEEGGKPIDPSQEGALHTLIRRELAQINIPGLCPRSAIRCQACLGVKFVGRIFEQARTQLNFCLIRRSLGKSANTLRKYASFTAKS